MDQEDFRLLTGATTVNPLSLADLLPYQELKKTTFSIGATSIKIASFSPQRSLLVFWPGGVGGAIWLSCNAPADTTKGGAVQLTDQVVITSATHGIMCVAEWYAVTMGIGSVLDVYEVTYDGKRQRSTASTPRIPRIARETNNANSGKHAHPIVSAKRRKIGLSTEHE